MRIRSWSNSSRPGDTQKNIFIFGSTRSQTDLQLHVSTRYEVAGHVSTSTRTGVIDPCQSLANPEAVGWSAKDYNAIQI
ncbi:hypothetical protein Tco_1458544 [Tanacetum coccineum]|uniref:Uncharacterized protein n=1 Tax=Tanacetum coccineum TaxID=301880 RepID=A0ABQ5B7A4_9ASTR